jgi:predicted ATPase/class 3 adenylate cyclase
VATSGIPLPAIGNDGKVRNPIPTGRVAFLFTDIEGSTRLWEEHASGMAAALEIHDAVMERVVARHDGYLVKSMGDGVMAAFADEASATAAALDAQATLAEQDWPLPIPLLARMGIHTGRAIERDEDYYGPTLNRAARLMGVGHGGQILISAATAAAIDPDSLLDLGPHRLRDLTAPEQIFQLLDPRRAADHPPLKTVDLTPNNLPNETTSLVGRDHDVATIADLLATTRLVTLAGFGGMGKTRLAAAAAADVVHRYSDGVWFCPLVEASEDSVPAAIASVLHVLEHGDTDLSQSLARAIDDKRMLMILDNCEHVVEPVRKLVDLLLGQCPNLNVLTTSRETLGIPEETVVQVVPLLAASLDDPAVTLFLERMQSTGAPEPTETDLDAVVSICSQVEGIPLAIELAAARTRSMTPADIDQRLGAVLGGGGDGVSPAQRQATIGSTIAWSHDLLSPSEQTLYRRLSVFVGGFDLDGAERVASFGAVDAGQVWNGLDSLVAKSMVLSVPGHDFSRYRMLEPVRDDALARLQAADEQSAALDAHLAHFADFGSRAVDGIRGPDEQWFLDRYFADFANMRAAVEHAVATENVDLAMQVSVPFSDLAVHQHRFELRDWLVLALGIPGAFDHPEAVHAAAQVVNMYGIIGKSHESLVWGGKVLELVGAELPPMVQFGLAVYGGMDTDLTRAAVATMRGIDTDDMLLEANIRMMVSGHVRRLDREEGVTVARENLAWAQKHASGSMLAYATVVVAENLSYAGHGPEAYTYALEAEALARTTGTRWFETHSRVHMGRAAILGAEIDEPARDVFIRALSAARDNGSTYQQWTAMEAISHLLAACALYTEAAIVHAGIQQSHIEWLRSGITPTANLERIPAEVLEEGAARAAAMDIADLVAYTLEALADVPDTIPAA